MQFTQGFAESTQKLLTSTAVLMCLIFALWMPKKNPICVKHNGYNAVSVVGFQAKCMLVFKEQLGDNAAVREEMGRKTKLKVLCDTCSPKIGLPTEIGHLTPDVFLVTGNKLKEICL